MHAAGSGIPYSDDATAGISVSTPAGQLRTLLPGEDERPAELLDDNLNGLPQLLKHLQLHSNTTLNVSWHFEYYLL